MPLRVEKIRDMAMKTDNRKEVEKETWGILTEKSIAERQRETEGQEYDVVKL